MITITLNKMLEHRPCKGGWRKLLKHLGKTKADDELFPFRTIVESNGLYDAIWALRCLEDPGPSRLLAIAYAHEVVHLMRDDRSVELVKIAHLYAYGEADAVTMAAARAAGYAAWDAAGAAAGAAEDAARAAAWAAEGAVEDAAEAAAWAAAGGVEDAARVAQRDWLLAIVDNY